MKRIAQRRLWRPLSAVRDQLCTQLESMGLQDKFMTFHVIGDAAEDTDYIREMERITKKRVRGNYFDGNQTPKVFVATYDCPAVDRLRGLRPDVTFVSMCDVSAAAAVAPLLDYGAFKHLVDLYAMAISEFVIVGRFSPLAWFSYFMRANQHSFKVLDEDYVSFYHNFW